MSCFSKTIVIFLAFLPFLVHTNPDKNQLGTDLGEEFREIIDYKSKTEHKMDPGTPEMLEVDDVTNDEFWEMVNHQETKWSERSSSTDKIWPFVSKHGLATTLVLIIIVLLTCYICKRKKSRRSRKQQDISFRLEGYSIDYPTEVFG